MQPTIKGVLAGFVAGAVIAGGAAFANADHPAVRVTEQTATRTQLMTTLRSREASASDWLEQHRLAVRTATTTRERSHEYESAGSSHDDHDALQAHVAKRMTPTAPRETQTAEQNHNRYAGSGSTVGAGTNHVSTNDGTERGSHASHASSQETPHHGTSGHE